jgi:TetR/AcrR family transcriptional regulator
MSMSDSRSTPSRRQQILQALARELQENPGERITTAALARTVGVTEAALYRHFPSKAKMFDGLLDFCEDSVFTVINRILDEHQDAEQRCEQILHLLLGFIEHNPGIARVLAGDALVGEQARLRSRAGKFFERVETQLKQVLREGELKNARGDLPVAAAAGLMLSVVDGYLGRYVRSGFRDKPLADWPQKWQLLRRSIF